MSDLIDRGAAIKNIEAYCEGCDNYHGVRCGACGVHDAIIAVDAVQAAEIDGDTSDGYHTFNELYDHRAKLFSVIVRNYPGRCWKSKHHHDGTMYDGMFIVGINTPDGQASYHYDIEPYWDMFDCVELTNAPEFDGYTPQQAIERIAKLHKEDGSIRRGKWIEDPDQYWDYKCSACERGELNKTPYCPHCGARMVG